MLPGVAAVQAINSGKTVQALDVPGLQAQLRAEKQVIDFLPGEPEQFEKGKHEKQF